jgi:chorismate mutase
MRKNNGDAQEKPRGTQAQASRVQASRAAAPRAKASRNEEISTVIDATDESMDPQTADVVYKISQLRQSIDNIDNAVVSLLAERFKATAQVGVLKAQAGFAPADFKRENRQMTRLRRIADEAGLDTEIAEKYREFVVEEAKKRHRRIAEESDNPGVLDLFA